ncbi:MAG: radical SAM protein [Candidatus Omnitrophota bacterium]|jgi:MoaA/NifB/PqqE/SkfB family radical SAM enzyme
MKQLTGLKKDKILFLHGRTLEFRRLPLRVQWALHRTLKNEKITCLNGDYIINSFFPPLRSPAYREMVKSTIAIYQKKPYPYSAYCAVTNRCGYHCWHCSKTKRAQEDLGTQTWQEIIRRLQDAGVSLIGLTGGEPLYREDLEDILRAISKDRAASILFTSGDGLTRERLKSLMEAGLDYVAVSLDHHEELQHNQMRGHPDAFTTALQAIEACLSAGVYTAVQVMARRELLVKNQMARFVAFVQGLGVPEIRIVEPMPTGELFSGRDEVLLDDGARMSLYKLHVTANQKSAGPKVAAFAYIEDGRQYGCGAGIQHMYVDASGHLCPCDFTPLSFGHIPTEGFDVSYGRLRAAFTRPGRRCFLLRHKESVREHYKGQLPLSYPDAIEICHGCQFGPVPDFYRCLGWA